MSALRPEVYREAAENIALTNEEWFSTEKVRCCCNALGSGNPHGRAFASMFRPKTAGSSDYWWTEPDISMCDQQARVLALLFMEQIAKDML